MFIISITRGQDPSAGSVRGAIRLPKYYYHARTGLIRWQWTTICPDRIDPTATIISSRADRTHPLAVNYYMPGQNRSDGNNNIITRGQDPSAGSDKRNAPEFWHQKVLIHSFQRTEQRAGLMRTFCASLPVAMLGGSGWYISQIVWSMWTEECIFKSII